MCLRHALSAFSRAARSGALTPGAYNARIVAATRPARIDARRDLSEARRIVLNGLDRYRARVWLFGSHARGDAVRGSDIDIAVLALEPLPEGLLEGIRQALEDSQVLLPVDLVDLSTAEPELRKRVEREGIAWRS